MNSDLYVLVVGEEFLGQRIILDLQESGYNSILATDIHNAFKQTCDLPPALIIIDRALDSALKLCLQIRSTGSTVPLFLLMGRDTVEDRAACLSAGADDYLLKPYSRESFLQLVNFYLQPVTLNGEQLQFADIILDLKLRRAIRNDRIIDLTVKEYDLLKFLMSHPLEVLTREQILENVWGYDFEGESNVIEVYIRYLRLKIEVEGEKRLIQTVRGVGYVLREG
jgi:two-component system, OmpR family, response regulator NblR